MMQWAKEFMPQHQARILELIGELDTEGVKILEPTFLKLCKEDEFHLVINCAKLTYINSQGLGLLVSGKKAIGERGYKLIVTSLQEPIRRLFEVIRFDKIFPICDSVNTALHFLGEK